MSEEQTKKADTAAEKSKLRLPQLAASAAAAVTAAFLGSTLGVEGTVAGAGIASVLTSVGSEIYLRSLSKTKRAALRTKEAARVLADTRIRSAQLYRSAPRPGTQQPGTQQPGTRRPGAARPPYPGQQRSYQEAQGARGQQGTPSRPQPQWPTQRTQAFGAAAPGRTGDTTAWIPAGERQPQDSRTVFIPRPNVKPADSANDATTVVNGADGVSGVNGAEGSAEQPLDWRRVFSRFRWPLIIGTSVLAFVLAILAISGIEGLTGNAISGGHGSTVGHLFGGGSGQSGQTPGTETSTPNGTDTKTTRTPTATANSENGGNAPSTQNKPSRSPSEEPSSSATATPTQSAPATGGNGGGMGGATATPNPGG